VDSGSTSLFQRVLSNGPPNDTDPNVTGIAIKAVHVRELQQRTDYQGDNR
jgi:hypothetical protein